jgi:hypothetical protein
MVGLNGHGRLDGAALVLVGNVALYVYLTSFSGSQLISVGGRCNSSSSLLFLVYKLILCSNVQFTSLDLNRIFFRSYPNMNDVTRITWVSTECST